MRSGNAAVRERGAVVIPPHCPSCRAPVTLACPNLTEALIVCSNEAVRPLPCVLATPMPPTRRTFVVAPRAQCLWPWDVTNDVDAFSLPIEDPRVAQLLGRAAGPPQAQPGLTGSPALSPMLQPHTQGASAAGCSPARGLPPLGSPFSGGSPFGGSALPPLGTPPSCLAGSLASELPQLELPSAAAPSSGAARREQQSCFDGEGRARGGERSSGRAGRPGMFACTYETSGWACRETESGAGNGPGMVPALYIH